VIPSIVYKELEMGDLRKNRKKTYWFIQERLGFGDLLK